MISDLIGSTITYYDSENDTDLLLGKSDIIALYFSGKYCKYCTEFTPILKKVYFQLNEEFGDNFKFDVVFISSDKSLEVFNENYETHPWYALPYRFREIKQTLVNLFKFKTIPQLVICNKMGDVIDLNGRYFITEHQDNVKNIKNCLTNFI